jgi:restriction system protein
MTTLIEGELPATWRGLEAGVARILEESGYEVEVEKNVQLGGRGDANFDVWAVENSMPPTVIAVECKRWADPATKDVVHGFIRRVAESGANLGLIVSAAGFQAGAVEAAESTNVRLITWTEFQEMFVGRWFDRWMKPMLGDVTEALQAYVEPVNSHILRKAGALTPERLATFKQLRDHHSALAEMALLLCAGILDNVLLPNDGAPILPLRDHGMNRLEVVGALPDDVQDALALRPLMDAVAAHAVSAIDEFDETFGERA